MKLEVFCSEDPDSTEAVNEVIEEIAKKMPDPDALILELGIDYDHEVVCKALAEKFPNAAIVGGTTDGEVANGQYQTESMVIAAIDGGKGVEIKAVAVENVTVDNLSEKMSKALNQAKKEFTKEVKFAVTWVEGLPGFDPGVTPKLFYEHFGKIIPIFGGSTGDYLRMKGTKQFMGSRALSQSIVYLMFAGDIKFASSIEAGWTPIGERHKITAAEGNILKEIDGRPVAEVLEKYTGSLENFCKNPFAVDDGENYYMLAGISLTPENHLMMGGTVPVDATFRFTETTASKLIDASNNVVESLTRKLNSDPKFFLFFSCSARRQLLGSSVDQEQSGIVKKFPNAPIVGQYCYGEFGPYDTGDESRMHNNTCIVLAVA